MNEAWIPVISGVVGAGGAVAAQIVAAYFTGKRETLSRRLSVHQERKQQLFAEILTVLNDQVKRTRLWTEAREAEKEASRAGVMATMHDANEDLLRLSVKVDLLAPEVVQEMHQWFVSWSLFTRTVEDDNSLETMVSDSVGEIHLARWSCLQAMRSSLGLDAPIDNMRKPIVFPRPRWMQTHFDGHGEQLK